METLIQDARFAVRTLLEAPAFALAAVLAVAVAASLLPARRAASVDPMVALRDE